MTEGRKPMNMQAASETLSKTTQVSSSDLLKEGNKFKALGAHKESLGCLLEAYMIEPENVEIQTALIDILACTSGYKLPQVITNKLANDAIDNHHNAQSLATVLNNQFEENDDVNTVISFLENTQNGLNNTTFPEEAIKAVLCDQLFLLVITKATSVSPTVERLIKALRHHFLDEWTADIRGEGLLITDYPEVLASVACQCFHTEYVFDVTEREEVKVTQLHANIMQNILAVHPVDLAILACYQPLWTSLMNSNPDDLQGLIDESDQWAKWMHLIWKAQFLAPCQEAFLTQNIEAYTPMEGAFLQKIAQQYEAFPYPRWQTTQMTQQTASLRTIVSQHFPYFNADKISDQPVNILFAGCGTGEQVVQVASNISSQNILAIDLSRNSLAYATRKAQEMGVTNAHFGQADILQVKDWDASFDVIFCTGVLHHMEDPSAGLQSLKGVAKENTLFSLALYSERARINVSAARKFIADHKIPDTLAGLRQFRTMVRELESGHPVKAIANSREFYSASGLHDYVFNTHEIHFTPKKLKALLSENDLEFIGFDLRRSEFKTLYQERFPDDTSMTNLDNWDTMETEYPDMFAGMMQFWCSVK